MTDNLTTLPNLKPDATTQMPHNLIAEQLVLGALLNDNELIYRVEEYLQPDYFYQPVHQRVFEQIQHFVNKGILASPTTLKNIFDKDAGLKELGGAEYLIYLTNEALALINPFDYAKIIHNLALRRRLINFGHGMLEKAFNDESPVSAVSQIEECEKQLYNLATYGNANSEFAPLSKSLIQAIEHATKAYENRENITGISSGFTDIDHYLGGFQNSDLVILAGRPSMGKTALAINFAINASNFLQQKFHDQTAKNKDNSQTDDIPAKPQAVGFFSLEMASEQIATRILSLKSGVSSSKILTGDLIEEDFNAIVKANKDLQEIHFFIDDTPALTISAIRARARRLKRRFNLGILFIDYLQLIRASSKSGNSNNRVQEISEITQGLKAIAKELGIPVIALSQLSRAVEQREDKRPQLSDLRESGSIEQDADVVLFIYREEYYLMRREPREDSEKYREWKDEIEKVKNMTDVIIAKHRNGPIGTPRLHCDSMTAKYSNFMVQDDSFPKID